MPSDDRVTTIFEHLAPRRDEFRSAVAEASEQLRAALSSYRSSTGNEAERAAFELGRFARGRIDPALFAQVFGDQRQLDPTAVDWIDRAEGVLQEIAKTSHLLQHVRVEPGGSLHVAVERALARIGRAFGAVRIAEYARAGQPIREGWYLETFPYAKWNRAERAIALPLVVEVNGSDFSACGLEEFLDGKQIIVLVVRGDAPPAALVRLITPNVMVVQSTAVDDVALVVAAAGGPAVMALVPETCAQFVHDRAGLTIKHLPREPRLAPRGRVGVFQQREELLQLERLVAQPAPADTVPGAPEPQPDDVLAGWLLRQADLARTS